MTLNFLAGLLSAVMYFAGTIPYMIGTIQGSVKPQRASWIIWLAVAVILTLNSRGQAVIYLYLAQLLCCLAIVIFSLPKGKGHGGWSAQDIISLMICAIALLVKQLFAQGDVSILLACVVEIVAFTLTYIKLYAHPDSEHLLQWVTSTITGLLAITAVLNTRVIYALYPVVIFLGNGIVSYRIYKHRTTTGKSAKLDITA